MAAEPGRSGVEPLPERACDAWPRPACASPRPHRRLDAATLPTRSPRRIEAVRAWIDRTEDARWAALDNACAADLTFLAATGVAS